MPIYEYQSSDGDVVERSYPSDRIPREIRVGGKRYSKIVSKPQVRREFRPYSTLSLPRNMKGFNHDDRGNCIIESRKQEREIASRTGGEWS